MATTQTATYCVEVEGSAESRHKFADRLRCVVSYHRQELKSLIVFTHSGPERAEKVCRELARIPPGCVVVNVWRRP